jgi:hypothetical protein
MSDFEILPETRFEEAYDLLCGERLGEGVYRVVYAHRHDPSLVVKVEKQYRAFCNAREWAYWDEFRHWEKGNRWLAPCVGISPLGTILLQKRTEPVRRSDKLPEEVPSFLDWDLKPANWGWLEGRLVLHDYPQLATVANLRMKKVTWEW